MKQVLYVQVIFSLLLFSSQARSENFKLQAGNFPLDCANEPGKMLYILGSDGKVIIQPEQDGKNKIKFVLPVVGSGGSLSLNYSYDPKMNWLHADSYGCPDGYFDDDMGSQIIFISNCDAKDKDRSYSVRSRFVINKTNGKITLFASNVEYSTVHVQGFGLPFGKEVAHSFRCVASSLEPAPKNPDDDKDDGNLGDALKNLMRDTK